MNCVHVAILAGFESAYQNAASSLRGVVRDEQGHEERSSSVREEQSNLFNWQRKKRAASKSLWAHKFVCLSSLAADRVPTSQVGKLLLEEAGLGEKTVTVEDIDSGPEAFRQVLLTAYPKLECGGGFELLRCKPQSRDLVLLSPRLSFNPRWLKRRVGNGKVYIRPIQRDLCLEEEAGEEEGEGVSWVLQF